MNASLCAALAASLTFIASQSATTARAQVQPPIRPPVLDNVPFAGFPATPQEFFAEFPEKKLRINEFVRPDLNGDGVGETIIPAIDVDPTFQEQRFGRVIVLSGWGSQGELHEFVSPEPNDMFATTVEGVGDFDGDGVDDLAVGAVASSAGGVEQGGRLYIYSGLTGEIRATITGHAFRGGLGKSVARVGDLNGDGRQDIVVGEPLGGENTVGRALVFYGRPPAQAPLDLSADDADMILEGDEPMRAVGFAVAGGMDIDGDGTPDIVAGGDGVANVFSGATGLRIAKLSSPELERHFGLSVSLIPDRSGDGKAEVAVGAPGTLTLNAVGDPTSEGAVYFFHSQSLLAAAELDTTQADHVIEPPAAADAMFGMALELGNDADGDGTPELLIQSSRFVTTADPANVEEQDNVFQPEPRTHVASVGQGAVLYSFNTGEGSPQVIEIPYPGPVEVHPLAPEDVNADAQVNEADMQALLNNFNEVNCCDGRGDVDSSGAIDGVDVGLVTLALGPGDLQECDPDTITEESLGSGCDCEDAIANGGPIPEMCEEPGGGAPPVGGGDPPSGTNPDCEMEDFFPPETEAECLAYAMCVADAEFDEQIDDINMQIQALQDQIQERRQQFQETVNNSPERAARENARMQRNTDQDIVNAQFDEHVFMQARQISANAAVDFVAVLGGSGLAGVFTAALLVRIQQVGPSPLEAFLLLEFL